MSKTFLSLCCGFLLLTTATTAQAAMSEDERLQRLAHNRHVENILALFDYQGPTDFSDYTHDALMSGQVDLSEYKSHHCYRVVPGEKNSCTRLFGPFASLEDTLISGELAAIFAEEYNNSLFVDMPTQELTETDPDDKLLNYWDSMMGNEFKYVRNIVHLFQRAGAEHSNVYDNQLLEASSMDFRQYVSHKCYGVSGTEIDDCKNEFGPYADLKETFLSGQLMEIIDNYNAALTHRGAEKLVREAYEDEVKDGDSATPAPSYKETIRSRSELIWRVCGERHGTIGQGPCYQRNHRLIYDHSLPLVNTIR